ncbi:hypothetical protein SAMN05421630_111146 [Prauserella marina]|uniref:Uncharacterized protein n=1 Tax=Prauserella marina TaxID=530584 RepID=A0A1G6WVY7_9PSEU|nr:hypothetical protein [Prauserella marina]PWV73177.1 hypothetical protein DES30_109127 [Prauserella marina]SDD70058.1 hypothetical protein SAMN05421630_111146 [Prauserella marina]
MVDKVVYVRQADEWLWTWASDYAKQTRRSLSAVVLMALEKLHDEVEPRKDNPRSERS